MIPPLDLRSLCANFRAAEVKSLKRTSHHQRTLSNCAKKGRLSPQDNNHKEGRNSKRRRSNSFGKTAYKPERDLLNCADNRNMEFYSDSQDTVPESAYKLMYRCLDLNPLTRTNAEEALTHEFLFERHKN